MVLASKIMSEALEGASSSLPIQIGPYRVLGEVGRGGMGIVFRAEHLQTGVLVALKTVRLPSEALLASIRREIRALSRIRHPGVARILDEGLHEGLPWYAMELLDGESLRDHLATIWEPGIGHASTIRQIRSGVRDRAEGGLSTHLEGTMPVDDDRSLHEQAFSRPALPLSVLRPLLSLLAGLCKALAFLHGEGLVHRDLKPENVLVRRDGRPTLLDLGIAACFEGAVGREELTAEGDVMGSVAYMAPEQIRGELVDARADLYAFGCMLYECLTGRAPFLGSTSRAILFQHLSESPTPPSKLADGIPPELEALTMRLLQKNPAARLGHASDVADVLMSFGAAPPPEVLPEPRAYLYRPGLEGRAGPFAELEGAMSRAASRGEGSMILIGGESGVGKTRVAVELGRKATQNGMVVITGQCASIGVNTSGGISSPALHPFRQMLVMLADRIRVAGEEGVEQLLGPGGKILASYEPSLAALPVMARQQNPIALPPDAARKRVLGALSRALLGLAAWTPVFLVLDDLQWADELSLAFLSELSKTPLSGHRLFILGTYRMEELQSELSAIVRAPLVHSMNLGRLEAGSVRAMVSDMLALPEPPGSLVEFLTSQAGGNPFFIGEYLRAAIARGVLLRGSGGVWSFQGADDLTASLPLPTTLSELIHSRLLILHDASRGLAQFASVLGREFDGDLLSSGAGLGDVEGMDAIEELRTRQILEECGDGRLRFVHDKLREITYEQIEEAQRTSLHLAAARVIEARYEGSSTEARYYPSLAHHFAKAGVREKAAAYFERAGDHAKAMYANEDAILYYQAALSQHGFTPSSLTSVGASRAQSGHLEESLADVLALTGRQEEARAAYDNALRRAPEGARVRRAHLYRKIGKTWETHHKHEQALSAHRLAQEQLGPENGAEGDDWWRAWVQILLDQIWVYYWLARVPEMSALADQVRPVIEQRGTAVQRARFFQALVSKSFRQDRYRLPAQTVEYARKAHASASASGDLGEHALMQFWLAASLLFHDDLEEAKHEMAEGVRLSRRVGDVAGLSRALTYLTLTHRRLGDVSGVARLAAESLSIASSGNMVEYIGTARANQAWLSYLRADVAAAEANAGAALAHWGQISLVYPFQWSARLPLLWIALDRGDLPVAVEQARAVTAPTQQRLPDAFTAALEQGISVFGQGDEEATREAFERARELAKETGHQ